MAKNPESLLISNVAEETKFDLRLNEKKIQHGFMTRQERDLYLKALPPETDYDFTSAEVLDAEDLPQ